LRILFNDPIWNFPKLFVACQLVLASSSVSSRPPLRPAFFSLLISQLRCHMFPIVPLLALGSILGGVVTLAWYGRLSDEEKEKADRHAGEHARQLFGKNLDQLTAAEAKTVASLLQTHLEN
jgi:hypothetical protein